MTTETTAAGDEAVKPAEFHTFFECSCPGMLARALLLAGHRQDAEDAVQQAYVEALRRWERVGRYDSPDAWVYKIVKQRLWATARLVPGYSRWGWRCRDRQPPAPNRPPTPAPYSPRWPRCPCGSGR